MDTEKQAENSVQHVENQDALDASAKLAEHQHLEQIEETQPGPFVWLCASAAAIGGMLFGYDTGVISGVLVVIGSDLDGRPLASNEKELITALCAVGAFVGAIVAGITADKYGRRPAIWSASVLCTIECGGCQSASLLLQLLGTGFPLISTLEFTEDNISAPAYIALAALIIFVAFYIAGLGCVPWQANELLPMEVHALGTTGLISSNGVLISSCRPHFCQ